MRASLNWVFRGVLLLGALYAVLFATVLIAMKQPPARFGAFMKRMPPAVVWGGLPAQRMWLWARAGVLSTGDTAPEFNLRTAQDPARRVSLSSYRGRPVVLVFGSYT